MGQRTATRQARASEQRGVQQVSYAEEMRQVYGRLVRRAPPPSPQGFQDQAGRRQIPNPDAERSRSVKKSPRLGSLAQVAQAWAEAQTDHYNQLAARHLAQTTGIIPADRVTELIPNALIERWRSKYAQGTAYNLRMALVKFLRHLEKIGGTPRLYADLAKIRRPKPRQTIATQEELERMVSHAEPWLRLFVLLCCQLALRFNEAVAISPAHYNPDTQTITYRKKGGDKYTLPITPDIAALFAQAPVTTDPTTPYLQLLRGTNYIRAHYLKPDTVRRAFSRLRSKAGVRDNITPHDLRRTVAVTLYELTKDIRVVQQLLGHSQLSSTAGYLAHRDTEKLRPLLEQLRFPIKPGEVKQ